MSTSLLATEQSNPLRGGMRTQRSAPPCTMVIFGASGDLTSRKLMPALFSLARAHRLAPTFSVIGVSLDEWSSEEFRATMRQAMVEFAGLEGDRMQEWESFASRMHFISGKFDNPEVYQQLAALLKTLPGTSGNVLFYLATPPSLFSVIVGQIGQAGRLGRQGRGGQQLGERLLGNIARGQLHRVATGGGKFEQG